MPNQFGTLLWLRTSVLATHLIIFMATAGLSLAGDPPPAEPAAATTVAPTEPPPGTASAPTLPPVAPEGNGKEKEGAFVKSMDETHEHIEQTILEQLIRIDKFFGTVRYENVQERFLIRWRNSIGVNQDGEVKIGTTARANIELYRISERLRLLITGQQEPEPFAPSLPQDPGNPGSDRIFQRLNLINGELRYDLFRTPDMNLFLAAGVRMNLPPQPYGRSRFQGLFRLGDVSLLRFAETFFVKEPDGPGETTEITLEHKLNSKTVLRLANVGTASYEINGMEWGSELSLIREISPKIAMTLTGAVYGNTNLKEEAGTYKINALYRQNFLRSWLFFELEPQFFWKKGVVDNFTPQFAFTMRLEMVFQGSTPGKGKKTGAP